MDLTLNIPSKTNICCCCLQRICFTENSPEYNVSKQKEVQDMLNDTFSVHIAPEGQSFTIHICEDCLCRLQDATAFKKIVVQSLKNYAEYFKSIISDTDKDILVKEEKKGPVPLETQFYDDQRIDDDDDEILSNIKKELTQNHIIERNHQNELNKNFVTRNVLSEKSKRKKCKMKTNESDKSNEKDLTQIIERRGNGPILRGNSLKLLANTTLCVFQYDRSRYRCFCCKEPYSDIHTLKTHTDTAHTLKHIEKKIITQQNRLVKVEISELSCKLCGNKLNYKEIRKHLSEKHNICLTEDDLLVPFKIENDLSCQICNEKFNVFRLLNIHMNKHFQKQICHVCGAAFSNLVFLNLHKTRSHSPFKCKKCNEVFARRTDVKKHDISVHKMTFARKLRFPCPYCDQRFLQENLRVLHLVEKHGFKKPEFKCLVCSKTFVTKSLCNNHLKNVHLKERTHECDVCHSFFYSRSDVNRHMLTHSGEKRFSCSVCGGLFASKDSLRRHLKRSHGDLP